VNDVTVESAREVVGESLDDLLAVLDGLSVTQLNRRPAGEQTNPIAILVAHALASTRSWLSLATGKDLPPRDRPAEFLTVARDADDFRRWAAAEADTCRATLARVVDYDPARERPAPWRSDDPDTPVTAAWAMSHAIAHLGEHVGHAQLTADVVRAS